MRERAERLAEFFITSWNLQSAHRTADRQEEDARRLSMAFTTRATQMHIDELSSMQGRQHLALLVGM